MFFISRIASFFSETQSELKKVVWPTRQETIRLTTIVIAVSSLVTVFIMLLDYIFTKLVNLIL